MQLAPEARTANCPYCDHPSVVERPPSEDQPVPSFVLGFVVAQESAQEKASRWIRSSSLFARSDFRKAAAQKTRSVYLPAYLYGALGDTEYSAQIGENYTVTETYTTTDSDGKTTTHTRTVTKTEWRSLAGQHDSYVRDIVVTASGAIENSELEAIEPFDLRALRRYEPAMVSGWTSEEPSLSRDECFALARQEALESINAKLGAFMPGDSQSDLRFQTNLHDEVVDLLLLPLWVFAVNYNANKPPVRILVNGQTGAVGGKVPVSWLKIAMAVVAVIGAIAGIVIGVQS